MLVFFLRLSPAMPSGLCNYLLGTAFALLTPGFSKLPFLPYMIVSAVGFTPVVLLEAGLGAASQDLTEIFSGSSKQSWVGKGVS